MTTRLNTSSLVVVVVVGFCFCHYVHACREDCVAWEGVEQQQYWNDCYFPDWEQHRD